MNVRRVCLIALMVATLTGGKLALAWFVPGIEIVTLLLITYALTIKRADAILACLIFIVLEMFIWPFYLWWVILYFFYWPALVIIISLLPRNKYGLFFAVVTGIIFTALFGVLSTLIEISLMGAIESGQFRDYFYFRYATGSVFFLTHIISNSIILPLLVPVLYKTLSALYARHKLNEE